MTQIKTRQHWKQRITFTVTAESNATRVQLWIGRHTNARAPSAMIPSPLAKRRGEGNNNNNVSADIYFYYLQFFVLADVGNQLKD